MKKRKRNALREAHASASARKRTKAAHSAATSASPALKRAAALWFRKANHGQALFYSYYARQPTVLPPHELAALRAILSTPLPVTFRLKDPATSKAARSMAARIAATGDAALTEWASGHFMWQAKCDRRALKLRRALSALLDEGVRDGLVNRQEFVSMLPVLALSVAAGAHCLDLCASPGSKTMQLMEAVAAPREAGTAHASRGVVIANDVHPSRLDVLRDSIARHGRPLSQSARLAITCHPAEHFPLPRSPFSRSPSTGFDRVLADVPCSGDGTIRKDSSVLPRWTPAVAHALHPLQIEIAWRGLQLLAVGGMLAYSTCSLNPIEDEAVVATLLARGEGAVELAPWPSQVLPQLVRRPGAHTWGVAEHVECDALGRWPTGTSGTGADDDDVRLRWHACLEDARAAAMPHVAASLWPPAERVAKRMKLELCSRLLPHDQDTGGFFVALLRKKAPLPTGRNAASGAMAKPVDDSAPLPPILQNLTQDAAGVLGSAIGMQPKAARTRLMCAQGARIRADALDGVSLVPRALASFAPGELRVVAAGIPLGQAVARAKKNGVSLGQS